MKQVKIQLISSIYSSEELYQKILSEASKAENIDFSLESGTSTERNISTEVLVAVVSGAVVLSTTILKILVDGLLTLHGRSRTKKENEKDRASGIIVIKGGDREVSFPSDIPEEKQKKYIELAEKWGDESKSGYQIAYIDPD